MFAVVINDATLESRINVSVAPRTLKAVLATSIAKVFPHTSTVLRACTGADWEGGSQSVEDSGIRGEKRDGWWAQVASVERCSFSRSSSLFHQFAGAEEKGAY